MVRKNNKAESITLTDFKLHYKMTIIKTVWYWQKDRHTNPWTELGTYIYMDR